MIEGTTSSGFAFQLNENVLDNMELVDLLAEGREDAITVSRIARIILDDAQRQRLYEHHRGDDGRVPYSAVQADIAEMFLAFQQPGKNS